VSKAKNIVANFQGMEDFHAYVYDASVVDSNLSRLTFWRDLQKINLGFLRDGVAEDDQARASEILHEGDQETYIASRVNPNILRGDGMNKDQLFTSPMVAAIVHSTFAVGASVTANNTSASESTPKPFKPLEYGLKMAIPPAWDVPKFGHKRYVAIREAYADTSAQPELEVDEGLIVVSGIAVVSTYHSLKYRHPDQVLTAYLAEGDPLDQPMVNLINALDMPTEEVHGGKLKGYTKAERVLRAAKRVGDVMETIEEMEGAQAVLEQMPLIRITKQDVRRDKRELHKKNEKAYWQDFNARQETKD
jgi:hypothetical protein